MDYQLETLFQKVKYCREAADVERLHTVRHIGEYTVGQHCFNMLTLLRILWPGAPKELVWAIVDHDLPERLTGDIPAPTKWFGIIDRDRLDHFDEALLERLFGDMQGDISGNPGLAAWLHGLDIVELWLYGRDQVAIGNKNMKRMVDRIESFISKNKHRYPPKILEAFYELRELSWEMMPDLGDINVSQ